MRDRKKLHHLLKYQIAGWIVALPDGVLLYRYTQMRKPMNPYKNRRNRVIFNIIRQDATSENLKILSVDRPQRFPKFRSFLPSRLTTFERNLPYRLGDGLHYFIIYIHSSAQDCNNSIIDAVELPQSSQSHQYCYIFRSQINVRRCT